MISVCTLNGAEALRATVILPKWGIWTADVQLANQPDDATPLAGAATIVLEDLTLSGTIVAGGHFGGRGWYKVVGGAAGWRKVPSALSYRGEAGVKASAIVTDAARELGETVASFADFRVGPAFIRPPLFEGARILDLVAKENWYVDESGVTHIGVRASSSYAGTYRLLESQPDQARLLLAPDTLVGLVPGASLEGITVATVRHEYTEEGLRSHVWGERGKTKGDRFWQALASLVRSLLAPTFYHGVYEYRISTGSGGYYDLSPQNRSLGLPTLKNVPVRVGAMGARGTPAANAGALVGFINGDPSRPFVHSFEGEWSSASVPTLSEIFANQVKLGDATAVALARSDKVANELAALQTAHNTHTHVVMGSVPITGNVGTTAIAATTAATTTTYTPGSVACSMVEGT